MEERKIGLEDRGYDAAEGEGKGREEKEGKEGGALRCACVGVILMGVGVDIWGAGGNLMVGENRGGSRKGRCLDSGGRRAGVREGRKEGGRK